MAKKSTTAKPKKAKGPAATGAEIAMPVTADLEQAFEKGMCLRVIMGRPGFRAKVDAEDFSAGEADTDLLHVSKETLDCPEFDAIKQLHGEIKKYLDIRSLPIKYKVLRGTWFVPTDLVLDCMKKVMEFKAQHDTALVPALIAVYEKAKAEARKRLKNLYDEQDYPSSAALAPAFYIKLIPFDYKTAGKLKAIDEKLFLEFATQLQGDFKTAALEMRLGLRQVIHQMVSHLTTKLGEPEDGKRKVLRKSAVGHIEDFLKFFEARNVTNDLELKTVIDRLRKVMDGVDPEALKKDDKYREAMQTQLGGLTTELDKLITTTGRAVKLPGRKAVA